MLRKYGLLALITVLGLGLMVGCSNGDSQEAEEPADTEENISIAYTTMDLSNPYFIEMVRGMEDMAEELGVTLTVHDGKSDPAVQIDAVENFIVQDVDVIVISANDDDALQPMVEKARDAGIRAVLSANVPLEGTDAHFDLVQYDYGFMSGQIAGEWIRDNLDGEAEVAVLGYPSLAMVIPRSEGIKEGILSIVPNAVIVAEPEAYTTEMGMSVTETILQANPNVKVICGINDAGVLGAYEAVRAAGKDTDDFCLVGLDATPEAIEKIKEGGIYRGTVDIQPYETGRLIIETALRVLKDGPLSEMVQFPMIPVTEGNVDQY